MNTDSARKKISICCLINNEYTDFKDTLFFECCKQLEEKYEFVYEKKHPQYVLYDERSTKQLKYYDSIRIQWVFENVPPNFFENDYIIGLHNLVFGDRYFQYPMYALPEYRYLVNSLREKKPISREDAEKKDLFCNFIYSNMCCSQERITWFEEIGKYKFVHAPGKLCHNTDPIPVGDNWVETFEKKTEYQKQFKFSMAFENTSSPGYISEKIFNAFRADTIPIYWGDPEVENVINEESFINLSKYSNCDEAIEAIKRIDSDDELYYKMLSASPIKVVRNTDFDRIDNELMAFLDRVFNDGHPRRTVDCKLWDYRYEKRYTRGALLYEGYMNALSFMYKIYKKIVH